MLEILQNFERAAARFATPVLIVPGLIILIIGLFMWLRGLSLRRLLASLIGTITGAICAFYLFSRNIFTTTIAACIAALVAIVFKRLIIAILLAALAAAVCFIILIAPYMKPADAEASSDQEIMPEPSSTLSVNESLQVVKSYAIEFDNKTKNACWQMPLYKWAIIAVSAIILIVPSLIFWRLFSALFFAAWGALLIYSGMVLLLLYKGSSPISRIADRSSFYSIVLVVMIAFGTIEQYLLCRDGKRQPTRKKPADNEPQEPQQTEQSWRNK